MGCFKFIPYFFSLFFFIQNHIHTKYTPSHLQRFPSKVFFLSTLFDCLWLITNLDQLEYKSWMDHHGSPLDSYRLAHDFERCSRHWYRTVQCMDSHNCHFYSSNGLDIQHDRDIRFEYSVLMDHLYIRLDNYRLDVPVFHGIRNLFRKGSDSTLDLYLVWFCNFSTWFILIQSLNFVNIQSIWPLW